MNSKIFSFHGLFCILEVQFFILTKSMNGLYFVNYSVYGNSK